MKALAKQTEENSPAARLRRSLATRAELERTLMAQVAAPRRPAARLTVRTARSAIACNEASKMASLLATDAARAAVRAWADSATAVAALTEPDDLLYLTVAELVSGALSADGLTGRENPLTDLITERRRTRTEYLGFRLPAHWTGQPQPLAPEIPADGPDRSHGHRPPGQRRNPRGPCPGDPGPGHRGAGARRGSGLPRERPELDGGVPGGRAVVVDVGGAASHGAIVARELGLPCVIGAGNATTQIRTGDLVRVDGTTGTVEILERHWETGTWPTT